MDLRLFFTLACALTLAATPVAAQDGPPESTPAGAATSPADPGAGAAPADSAADATDDGTPDASASSGGSNTAAADSGGAQPGAEWQEAPVIHEPVGTTSDTNQAPTAAPAEEDDGRSADLLWLELGFGYSWADLAAFSSNNFVPGVEQISGSGYAGHAAAGLKLFFLTLGARGTVGSYPQGADSFDIWSLMFDAMLRIPILFLEPYLRAGIGYAWMGSLNREDLGNSSVTVFGLTVEAGAGIDFYLGKFFSLGAGFDIAFLNLTRQRIDDCGTVGGAMCNVGGVDFQEEGDAAGFQLRATGHAALHF